jgi:hypothetical protein
MLRQRGEKGDSWHALWVLTSDDLPPRISLVTHERVNIDSYQTATDNLLQQH